MWRITVRSHGVSPGNHRTPPRVLIPAQPPQRRAHPMNSIVYIVGAVVIVIAVLSFFGLR